MSRWTRFVSGPGGRRLTIALLILQLGGCVLDMQGRQASLMAAFCLAARDDDALVLLGGAVWIVLALSWTAGLFAVRWPILRPIYWSLLAAIPLAWAAQAWLLYRHFLFCDAP
ncbi:MAG: hypothetical protein ACJ8ER_01775 [Allosphingosinicella sp.]